MYRRLFELPWSVRHLDVLVDVFGNSCCYMCLNSCLFADVIICDTFFEGIAHKIAEFDRGLR